MPADTGRRSSSLIRWAIYSQVAAIVVAGGFSYTEQFGIWRETIRAAEMYVALLLILSGVAFFVCPLLMLVALFRTDADPWQKIGLIVLEAGLILAHMTAFLPMVQ